MKNILIFCVFLALLEGCKIDNYEEPNLTVSGKIVDSQSGALIESGGSNGGTIVKFYQDNSAQALLFKTKPDGTFTNSRVFPGTYRYVAEGPFVAIKDTPSISIQTTTDLEIKVVPNVRLRAEVLSKTSTEAVIKISFEKLVATQKLMKIGVVWSTVTHPNIFTFAGGNIDTENVQALNLTSGERLFTVKNIQRGGRYFVRAFAATDAPGNYHNYSVQIDLQ